MSLSTIEFTPEPETNKTKIRQDGKTYFITTKNIKTADRWYKCNGCGWLSVEKLEICPICFINHNEVKE